MVQCTEEDLAAFLADVGKPLNEVRREGIYDTARNLDPAFGWVIESAEFPWGGGYILKRAEQEESETRETEGNEDATV